MAVTKEELKRIATLARLRLEAEEVEEMSVQLSSILDHMEELRQANVAGVAPVKSVGERTAPLRADEVGADALHCPPAALAPEWIEPFFVVPRLAALDSDARAAEAAGETR